MGCSLSGKGSHSLKRWPWGWGLFNLAILRAFRWARQMLEWCDLPFKMGGEAPEAVHFHGWGTSRVCHGVICVSQRMEFRGSGVKLSAAVATHSIPLQYIHTVLYQLPLPTPIKWSNGSCGELNHISDCDGETCKLHCIGHAIGTVCS